MPKRAVVLLQLGGPDSLDAVEPFLYNLFSDPDIIDLPGAFLFRKRLARMISARRAPKVEDLYRRIGGRSPILPQTLAQAESLKKELEQKGHPMHVTVAMRYWHPFTDEIIQELLAQSVDGAILLPLYPHYSRSTTGSSVNEWKRTLKRLNASQLQWRLIEHYYDHPLYIEAVVERIREVLEDIPAEERSAVHLVFSAHGTPVKLVKAGDPYASQVRRTYELVVERGEFGLPHHLCFQSKVGPQRWLEPSLTQTIRQLGEAHVTHAVVIPISFVSDHIETLSEINIEAREEAHTVGISSFAMTEPLLISKPFIGCLADLVINHAGGKT
ncbi:MAG: ferrochelatase [Ignavibacteria bacterium]|nr:ferrochelatase [Ignavibacteria bacterium]